MSQIQDNAQSSATHAPEKVDWYVYYRARAEFAARLQMRVTSMQTRILLEYGIAGALKRRPHMDEGRHTWMEVYLSAPLDFDVALTHAAQAAKLPELTEGERHIECFWEIASCA
jgi:hypothetical protein